MSIVIGSFLVKNYTDSSDYIWAAKPGEVYVTGKGDDTLWSGATSYLPYEGKLWSIPSILIGGDGSDSYRVGYGDFTIVSDSSLWDSNNSANNDHLRIYDYARNIDLLFTIDDRHVLAGMSSGTTVLIVDGLDTTKRGTIESIEFSDVSFSGSHNSLSRLVDTFKTHENQSVEQVVKNGWLNPAVMGLDGAAETKSLLEGASEIKESDYMIFEDSRIGQKFKLAGVRDFDGNLHGGASPDSADDYLFQGRADVNNDNVKEAIYTNDVSGRWVTLGLEEEIGPTWGRYPGEGVTSGSVDYDDNAFGVTRVVGLYDDPLVLSGEVEAGSPHDSQVRFQNDLYNDNLRLGSAADVDNDGFGEVFWKTTDGSAYLRSIHHLDGNVKYANYMNSGQMTDYLSKHGHMGDIGYSLGI